MLTTILLSLTPFFPPMTKAADSSFVVDGASPTVAVSRDLFGIFFEEINRAGEGGLYAELLRNRELTVDTGSIQLEGWSLSDTGAAVDQIDKLNPARSASLHLVSDGKVAASATNGGFWGLHLKKGSAYRLVLWVKGSGTLSASLGGNSSSVAATNFKPKAGWKHFEAVLKPSEDSDSAELRLRLKNAGDVRVGYASLMPVKTWRNRANGLSPYLATEVAGLHPAFVRFPGGCFIEGPKLAARFRWQDSIGPIEDRPALPHSMWGYSSSNGLGFHEYLQWCEDMGSSALFVANCGLSHSDNVPLDQMQSRIDDVLNSLQYAIGDKSTPYGSLRAKAGHPAPFPLKYVEIGNENGYSWAYGGPKAYYPRYKVVYDAIKKAYPQLNLIADVPTPTKDDFVDEHYYQNPAWFWRNAHRYDTYPRTGPKIYVGEYAVTVDNKSGFLDGALSEAAFMTGMEQNSDIVKMSSYAPLLENVHDFQWQPNAIIFDGSKTYGTPSYWVQALFSKNRPDVMLKTQLSEQPLNPPSIDGGVGLKTWSTTSEFKNINLAADGQILFSGPITAEQLELHGGDWTVSDGVVRQTGHSENCRAFLKGVHLDHPKSWHYSFDARAIDGAEGFMGFVSGTASGKALQWNIGGWGNSQTAYQRDDEIVGRVSDFKVIDGQWYHVEMTGENGVIRSYIDGKLIEELHEQPSPTFTGDAGYDQAKHEIIIKLINGGESAREVDLKMLGLKLGSRATMTSLTGQTAKDENTFADPLKISPRMSTVKWLGTERIVTVPAFSLLIVRVQAKMSPASQ